MPYAQEAYKQYLPPSIETSPREHYFMPDLDLNLDSVMGKLTVSAPQAALPMGERDAIQVAWAPLTDGSLSFCLMLCAAEEPACRRRFAPDPA